MEASVVTLLVHISVIAAPGISCQVSSVWTRTSVRWTMEAVITNVRTLPGHECVSASQATHVLTLIVPGVRILTSVQHQTEEDVNICVTTRLVVMKYNFILIPLFMRYTGIFL